MMKTAKMAIAEAKARGYDPVIVDERGHYWEENYAGEWTVITERGWELDVDTFDDAEVIRENYCDEEKFCYINVAGEF